MARSMITLTDWLLEQITVDEAKASAKIVHMSGPAFEARFGITSVNRVLSFGHTEPRWVVPFTHHDITVEVEAWAAEHGEPADPRMLAECAAKRALLELHHRNVRDDGDQCAQCGFAEDWEIRENGPTFPCATLRILVAIYADRPGYDPAWGTE